MKFKFEIYIQELDITISIENLDIESLRELTQDNSLEEIWKNKYYMFLKYDRVFMCGKEFLITKNSKKYVGLMCLGDIKLSIVPKE